MTTVNEIMNLTLFKKFKILTGKEYLSNTVTTAVILEYESSRINYAGYCFGYFVLISYFFASTNPELVNGSIKRLIQKKVSGIAIKMLPEEQLPQDIIKCAKENHVPILTFYDEFMEDLIININESMKTRAQYIIHEEKLNRILNDTTDKNQAFSLAKEINSNFKDNIISAVLIPKEDSTNLKVHTFFDSLMYHRAKMETQTSWSFIKLKHNIVLICSFDTVDHIEDEEKEHIDELIDATTEIPFDKEEAKNLIKFHYIQDLLIQNGFSSENFYIGFDEELLELSDIKESVKKAYTAAEICKFTQANTLSYKYTGIYKYAYNMLQDEIIRKEIKNKIEIQ